IDLLRGVVMIIMALDHVRDYVTNLRIRPEDLSQASAFLFATRWVTHFCAPTFFLLTGVGIGISYNRGKTPRELSRYLVTRGLWLLVLELIITPIGWQFGFKLIPAFALVLWALGWAMIFMAVMVHLPRVVSAVVALALIAGHNLFDKVAPESLGSFGWLLNVLHVPGFVIPGKLFVGYPLIPWIGVTALGFAIAVTYKWEDLRRRQFLLRVGAAVVVLFIVVRGLNGYGNPQPWTAQKTSALTVASFLNVNKYPPSLDFLLMTLGPALLFLALAEKVRNRFTDWLSVYGRVPLFFYVTHIFVAHVAAMIVGLIQTGQLHPVPIIHNPDVIPQTYGVSLPGVYLVWILVVLALYYPCRRFARLKETRSDWWLSYL
ncbi:MAG TPA: heparan-alpha-glucosaminide N-acetyltransferase domain-containing protein, partial [Longimicrobiales bacterium]|nr:heparan-alpha-glucosaminide N-acetyltransferase domain-containing protein [Longimicrobiales bacterium]